VLLNKLIICKNSAKENFLYQKRKEPRPQKQLRKKKNQERTNLTLNSKKAQSWLLQPKSKDLLKLLNLPRKVKREVKNKRRTNKRKNLKVLLISLPSKNSVLLSLLHL